MILLAALRLAFADGLQRLNGLKNVMVSLANGVAAVLFVIVAHVAWDAAAILSRWARSSAARSARATAGACRSCGCAGS